MFVQVLPSFLTTPFLPSTGDSRRCRGTPTLSSLKRRYPRFLTLWLFLPGTFAQKTQLSPELAHRPQCVCTKLFVNTVSVALEPGSRAWPLSHTVRVISSLDLWLTRWVTLGEYFNLCLTSLLQKVGIIVILLPTVWVVIGMTWMWSCAWHTQSLITVSPGHIPLPNVRSANESDRILFPFCGYILLDLQPQLHWHHLLEITLDFLLLTQLCILCAHIVLGWDTLMNHIVMFCVLKSVCFSLPLDLSPLGFLRSGPVSYTLLYPEHLVSLQNTPFSRQHVVLVWWARRDFRERQLGAQSPLCRPHYISHADRVSISYAQQLF